MILKPQNKTFINIKDLFQSKNVDIDKIVVSNKFSLDKKGFNFILLATKTLKKLDLFVYLSHK